MNQTAGPKVVAIGGGNGLSTMLRGLKSRVSDLTAVVTVADDGGGSGVLRQDLNMPPPGDIRNCMEALASAEGVMGELLSYRFPEGALAGQAFGNLLLAALNGISASFDQAVARMSEVLAISGRVLPVTNANVQLEAEFENDARVLGESRICDFKKSQDCRIRRVRLLPGGAPALPDVVEAIRRADLILLGPGSLYTSVIPNLLVDGVDRAIARSEALKVYVCNIMTQDGETEDMTAADHVLALMEHGLEGLDVCLCNSAAVPPPLLERYRAEDARPTVVDASRLQALGVAVVEAPLTSPTAQYARHDPERLARAVLELYRQRGHTKVF